MSSSREVNKELSEKYKPKQDYSSENCPKRIIFNGEIKKYCKINDQPCKESYYNHCPLFKGQNTLI